MRYKQSYREKPDPERAALVATGLVSERHAGISNIEFRLTYYRSGFDEVLMERTLCFLPADYAGFHLKCMEEGCAGGGFDLAPVVERLAKAHKKSVKGKLFCRGRNHAGGRASIAYEVNIRYAKQVK